MGGRDGYFGAISAQIVRIDQNHGTFGLSNVQCEFVE